MQLIVLGMHRSGTSVLTHLLAAMGGSLGSEDGLLEADEANPRGYWERRDVVELNDRILRAAGAEWWRPAGLDLSKIEPGERRRLTEQARALIETLEPRRPWVIKDPRLCLTLPFWQRLLTEPVCVLISRSPVEVARSLRRRDGLPIPLGLALWELYTLQSLKHTKKLPRRLLSYHKLIERPVAAASWLHRELEPYAGGSLRALAEEEVSEIVDASLHRQRISPAAESRYLSAAQARLAGALEDRSILDVARLPSLSAASRDALEDFERIAAERDEIEEKFVAQRRRYQAADRLLVKERTLYADDEVQVDVLRGKHRELAQRFDAQTRELAEVRDALRETRMLLTEERDLYHDDLAMRDQKLFEADAVRRQMQDALDKSTEGRQTAERRLAEERERSAEALRARDRALAEGEAVRREMQAAIDSLVRHGEEMTESLDAHARELEQARDDYRAVESLLRGERERHLEALALRDRALAEGETVRQAMQATIDTQAAQQRALEESLETHAEALAQARADYRDAEARLRAERERTAEALRVRDEVIEHKARVVDELEGSVVELRAHLEEVRQDLDAHRDALARERRQAASELAVRDQVVVDKDRVIEDFARGVDGLTRELRARDARIEDLETGRAQLERELARLTRENRLAFPLVRPIRVWLRLWDGWQEKRRS